MKSLATFVHEQSLTAILNVKLNKGDPMRKMIAILSFLSIASTALASNTIDLRCKMEQNGQAVTENKTINLLYGETVTLGSAGGYTVSIGRFNGPHVTVKFKSSQQEIIGMYYWMSAIDASVATNGNTISLGCSSLARTGQQ